MEQYENLIETVISEMNFAFRTKSSVKIKYNSCQNQNPRKIFSDHSCTMSCLKPLTVAVPFVLCALNSNPYGDCAYVCVHSYPTA